MDLGREYKSFDPPKVPKVVESLFFREIVTNRNYQDKKGEVRKKNPAWLPLNEER